MGSIDVDPASNAIAQIAVRAGTYYSEERSGLLPSVKWEGNVWLNPPYGRDLPGPFVDKLLVEIREGRTKQAILLTNASHDTAWWRAAGVQSSAICLPDHRIAFINPLTGKPERGNDRNQIFAYFGPNPEHFCHVFRAAGACFAEPGAWCFAEPGAEHD